MSRRTDRVEDLLRHELATLLRREMADPRVRMAVISHVDVAPNLELAKVRVSVIGDETQREQCIVALQRASGYLRSLLARRLRIKVIPELSFSLDRGAEHSLRIAELLEASSHDHDD